MMKKEILVSAKNSVVILHNQENISVVICLIYEAEWHSCEVTLGPGQSVTNQVCSGLLWSPPLCPAQFCSAALAGQSQGVPSSIFCLSASVGKTHSSVFNGQGKCALRERGLLTYIARSLPTLLVSDCFILIKMRTPKPQSLSGPKDTVLIGQNVAILTRP